MNIYISGRISGLSEKEYTKNFTDAGVFILLNFVPDAIVNPVELKHNFKFYWGYILTDLYHLSKCDTIALMPNWIDSKGACIEHLYAKFILKLKVIYL